MRRLLMISIGILLAPLLAVAQSTDDGRSPSHGQDSAEETPARVVDLPLSGAGVQRALYAEVSRARDGDHVPWRGWRGGYQRTG
jgi:hypothetical protein